jgi:hypothetical protein
MGEGAIVRDCGGIGRMRAMCKVGIIDYSLVVRGGRDSKEKWRKRRTGI